MADAENIRAMKKSTRKSMPKVRTGCLTCKQRRIKCDEGKPSCRNCSRTGRPCEGYPEPMQGDSHALQPSQRLQIRVYNLPFKVPGSQADRQLLHFYCCEAACSLSSFSDPTLWTNIVLQRSHHQPVIRHALVTLAALYRDYLQAGNNIQTSALDAGMQRIAKCHRQLRLYLRSPNATPDTPLICSILFYAFEVLIDDSSSAIQHLNNGLTLLRQCQNSQDANDDLLPHITSIFSRLDIHASTFDDTRMPILSLVTPEETSGAVHAVPAELTSVEEAEALLTKLQNWLMHHIIAHVAHKGKPVDELPSDLLQERFVLYQQYQRFLFALDTLLHSLPAESTHRAILLRIQARMYHAILLENIPDLTTGPSPSEPSFNASTPLHRPSDSLQDILADIQTFLSLDTPEDAPRNFTLSTQLVAILYFLCLKTNDVQSRLTALSLLQHSQLPPKDGLWDARKAVSVIQTLMDQTRAQQAELRTLEDAGTSVLDVDEGGIDEVLRRVNTPRPLAEPLHPE
ncbi:hypothetical protein BDV12DRAFT_138344 [Aspergillus spectabilis]